MSTYNYFLSFFFSGRKRRGSETFSDSSGDEFFTGFKEVSTPKTMSKTVSNRSTSPVPGKPAQTTRSRSLIIRNPVHTEHSRGRHSGSNGAGGGESEECTAALVLMNLSHNPLSAGLQPTAAHSSSQSAHNSSPRSATTLRLVDRAPPSRHHDNLSAAAPTSHQGHVRCLPGGACLVGEPASKMHSDQKQVQGKNKARITLFSFSCRFKLLKSVIINGLKSSRINGCLTR